MADNVYLLETRLSSTQQAALATVRDVARENGLTVFLVGGAVRDLISGSPVRDLDFAVQGEALKLRKGLEQAGGVFSGENKARQAVYFRFPGGVRVEIGRTLSVTYPKPGKPVYAPVAVLEDLRRRDFTANAMALSLNEGSYGLLMDPLNGVADIENRELRLVSNYGFIEDPVRMIRAARLMARQGWQLEERTRSRYETGKEEEYIRALQPAERDYEVEELFHEEDPLRVMGRLEEEGWLKHLSGVLSVAKANTAELAHLREVQMQLQTHGIKADASAANFPLLTAKLAPGEAQALSASFPRTGFVEEIANLEVGAKEFTAKLLSKEFAAPSKAYQYILQTHPATVLWAAYSTRSGTLQARFKSFYNEWPQAFTKVPYPLLAEMRITQDLPGYNELIERLIFGMMDGELGTPEEMRAFLEPFSPPAPPPPISLRRPRAPRKESKSAKPRKKAAAKVEGELVAETEGEAPEAAAVDAAPAAAAAPVRKPAKKAPVAEAVATEKAAAPVAKEVPAAVKAVPAAAKEVPAVAKESSAAKEAAMRPAQKSAGKEAAAAKAVKAEAPAPEKKAAPVVVEKKPAAAEKKSAPAEKQPAKVAAKAAPVPAKSAAKAEVRPKQAAVPVKEPARKAVAAKAPAAPPKVPAKGAVAKSAVVSKAVPAKKAVAKSAAAAPKVPAPKVASKGAKAVAPAKKAAATKRR